MEDGIRMSARPPARIITAAWGEHYVNELLSLTLPALLAPGNLPELVTTFSCEFVLATEKRFFGLIQKAPVFKRLQEYCTARLLPIDDLVFHGGSYGLSLTYAYHRAFADLGERMTDYYLFFFNADFILADGCYRSVITRLQSGERLILAPSYCVNAEMVAPIMQARVDLRILTLSVQPREMAALALENRHNTIRGKTVNQSLCHLEWIEQFYWNVDEHTLLAHQLPIAIVCMRPEKVYIEPVTFWDYGLLSEICPSTKPCILSDSDEFLMIELRKMSTAEDQFLPGWPSVKEIALKLEQFSTKDQRDHAQYQLVLHSHDLPPETAEASIQLRAYVESVLRAMKPALDHRNHAQWTYHCNYTSRHLRSRQIAAQLLGLEQDLETNVTEIDDLEQVLARRNFSPAQSQSSTWRGRLFTSIFGCHPRLTRNHGYWSDLRYVVDAVDRAQNSEHLRRLLVTEGNKFAASLVEEAPGFLVSVPVHVVKKRSLHLVNDNVGGRLEAILSVQPKPEDEERKPFDVCFCELDFDTLIRFRDIFNNIRNVMKPSGKIIIFHLNSAYRPMMGQRELSLLLSSLLAVGSRAIYFTALPCPLIIRIARKLVRIAASWREKGGVSGRLVHDAAMLLSVPFARFANGLKEQQSSSTASRYWTSVTIEIDVQ